MELTHEHLLSILSYNQNTGEFVWIKAPNNRVKVGQMAGTLDKDGYIKIRIRRKEYRACRLAWFYIHGVWPTYTVDHKDAERTNDSFNNLRQANNPQQNHNRKKKDGCSSNYKGVSLRKWKRWEASITINGRKTYLGSFKTEQEAALAYNESAIKHFGEFAKLNDLGEQNVRTQNASPQKRLTFNMDRRRVGLRL